MNIHNKESRIALPALLIFLIIVGLYIWKSSHSPILPSSSVSTTATTSNSQVGVPTEQKTNTTFDKVVPPGFPSDIPVESAHIVLSNKSVYTDRNATQYTVSYTSSSSQDALMKLYTGSLIKAGYIVNKDTTNAPTTVVLLNAVKDKNILMVVILNTGKESSVQLNLLVRP